VDQSRQTLIKVTTVPESLLAFHKGHGALLNVWFNVIAVSSGGPELDAFSLRENIRTIPLKMNRRISVFSDLVSVYKMIRVFRREKPYIVHSMTPKAGLVAMMAAYLTRVPHRIHTFTGLIFPTEKGVKRLLLMNIDRLICAMATIVIPEGTGVKNDLLKSGVTKKDLRIIANGSFNGIDPDYFRSEIYTAGDLLKIKSELLIDPNDFVFIFIGRIVRDKGIEELIKAFVAASNDLPEIELLLVGNYEENLDPLSEEVTEIIKTNKRIRVVGYQKDIRPYLAVADIFVFPSYREGFPNTVLEAGAMGLPCIVTDINGSNEIIKDGTNGIVISKQNVTELRNAIVYMYNNGDIVAKMRGNARQMIMSRYDRKTIQQELLRMYLNLG
jgi:glycosyltransferase involved in cell wall biosynthesis